MNSWNQKFDKFVGHFTQYQDRSQLDTPAENAIKVIDTDIGRRLEFSRIAVHHVVLPAGSRTSSPHAESLEEEFVFVIKGTPQLWLNGFIYDLKEGHAVGFPSGTGVAHTFINNTELDVELLVAGEKTKSDNLCAFPINPELKAECQIWWNEPPRQKLGPHNGLPGSVRETDRVLSQPACVFDCSGAQSSPTFHYPGDNETFGAGVRITDKVDLAVLGVNYEVLAPGRRSAFPHAHTHEEEFIFVLKGRPTVWMDGYTKQLSPGDFAGFPANTGIAHTIINDSTEEVIYLCIGETAEFQDEKVSYPLNPIRSRACARYGFDWEVPRVDWGTHNGRPQQALPNHLALRLCDEQSAQEVFDIYCRSPEYFIRVEGCLPTIETVKKDMAESPPNQSDTYIKEFLIIEHDGSSIGVVDLHGNHPEEGICYLGLLLLRDDAKQMGTGSQSYKLIEDYVRRAMRCKSIRLGVSETNDVSTFWLKMGFEPNGRTYKWKGQHVTANVREFEKALK